MFNLLNIIFPPLCINCRQPGSYLCKNCHAQIDNHPIQKCSECNKQSISGKTHPRCQKPLGIDGIWAIFKNQTPIKQLIYQQKYRFSTTINQTLIQLIYTRLPNFINSNSVIIPMPISKSRHRWRGFNQTTQLAKSISKRYNSHYQDNIIFRSNFSQPQAKIEKRIQRLKNPTLKFKINPNEKHQIKNRQVIIVDDIATTGTTLKKAAQILKRNKARSVWGLVIAR